MRRVSPWRSPLLVAIFIWLNLLVGGPGLQAQPEVPLFNTYWRVSALDSQPVTAAPSGREPHLVLTPEGQRVHGSTGCNRFTGSFVQTPESFQFKPLATTRMACPPPADKQERAFLQALEATRRLRQTGPVLELLDDQGTCRVRLEAQGPAGRRGPRKGNT